MGACRTAACVEAERESAASGSADTAAIIVAGGSGVRFGDPLGKQFAELCGQPLITWSLLAFDAAPSIGHVVVVCARERRGEMRSVVEGLALKTPVTLADAGEVRQESVASGLAELPAGYAFCAVHDAARPLIETETIERAIAALRSDSTLAGTIVARRATDTLKLAEDGIVVSTPDRSFYWAAQTPQTFRVRILRAAYDNALFEDFIGTDDASLVERAGGKVLCVEPLGSNLKVTYPDDLALAEAIMRQRGCGEALV